MSDVHPKDLPELMEDAARRGFESNFQLQVNEFCHKTSGKYYALESIKVVDVIIKDQQSTDPGDEATLYLLEADDGEKGILVIADPMSLSPDERRLLERLNKGGR